MLPDLMVLVALLPEIPGKEIDKVAASEGRVSKPLVSC